MLRNPKGATSLRWLQVLLDDGIEVHGQIVVCPGVNDGTACPRRPWPGSSTSIHRWRSAGAVPLGLSRYSNEPEMRPHTEAEAAQVDTVHEWQGLFRRALGHRMIFAVDEYYLLAGRDLPPARHYEGFPQHENGIGMARSFAEFFTPAHDPGVQGACATGSSSRSTRSRRGLPCAAAGRTGGDC